jgi:hypothetical protein
VELLQTIEASALARALKSSFYVYPLVNAAHIAAVGSLVATAVLMDMRLLGLLRSVEAVSFVRLMRRVAATSFLAAAVTGLALFSVRATEYVFNPAFLAKLSLIGLAGFNILAFQRAGGGAEASSATARASAALSIAIWLGALTAGRFIGFL